MNYVKSCLSNCLFPCPEWYFLSSDFVRASQASIQSMKSDPEKSHSLQRLCELWLYEQYVPCMHLYILSDFQSRAPCWCCCCLSYLLVGLFALRAPGARATVVSLNDEGVFLLQLAVHQATGPQLTLARRTVQHHCFEWRLQPVDVERTDLP